MSLTRGSRQDRRRRSMREAVAAESGVAVESVRARTRRRSHESDDEESYGARRDPGYSQEVRFACQQRLVQLIPVRKSTMAAVVGTMLSVWFALLLAHYIVNVRGSSISGLNIAHIFHIRSPHSLSHWLGSQMWMFTGIVSVLIYQLRRHKLDDYRAKYRIWLFLAGAAFFSSYDASTSALYIIGTTIDPWTQRQFSLPGWPVVLASFASLVGVLGLRLCTELKSSPGSVTLWLVGLATWAYSAILGTGLIKSEWSPAVIDMTVGATWLGGILCVFLASTLYLRHIYIQAQKRFALRNKWLAERQKWNMPKVSLSSFNPKNMATGLKSKLRRRTATVAVNDGDASDSRSSNTGTTTNRSTVQSSAPNITSSMAAFRSDSPSLGKSTSTGTYDREEFDEVDEDSRNAKATVPSFQQKTAAAAGNSNEKSDAKKSGSWIPWKRNREGLKTESDAYSDVGASPRVRDRGLNSGFEKVGAQVADDVRVDASSQNAKSQKDQSSRSESTSTKAGSKWNPFAKKTATVAATAASAASPTSLGEKESKRSWSMGVFKRNKKSVATADSANKEAKKKSFFTRRQKPLVVGDEPLAKDRPAVTKPTVEKKKSSWFGFLDGLTLKPPTANEESGKKPQPQVSIPSTSSGNRPNPPQSTRPPANQGQAVTANLDDLDDDNDDNRHLSKAERKRLRRQQQQNRAA